jgi:hypothetical protein
MTSATEVLATYTQRAAELRLRRVTEARTVDRLGNLRLAAFAAAVLLTARGLTAPAHATAWLMAALAAAVAFAWLVRASTRAKMRLQRTDDLIDLADEGGHRVSRAWDRLPDRDWPAESPAHPYAIDLDLFGPGSLTQLLPPLSRAPGRQTMRRWLTAPADADTVRARQRAVAELRRDREFREALAVASMRVTVSEQALTELAAWAGAEGWLVKHRALSLAALLVPVATLGLIAAQVLGALAQPYWIIPALAAWALVARNHQRLTNTFAPLAGRTAMLRRYAAMARLGAGRPAESARLTNIASRLAQPVPAARAMQRLTALADSSELRLSPMLYFVVNTLTLWDFHVVRLLERWQRDAGRHAGDWFDALGELEALSAFATLAEDNPSWTPPEIDPMATSVTATALGHPLLADTAAVRNDVEVGPAGTILLVTGSNMAGKSTLLRAIGLNLVLSQAGAVVCADRFRHPPALLHTSMRVQDSLQRGVSYFMAELERLKSVVDAADAAARSRSRLFVYLLDEILHGTNSAERTIAARRVLQHLVGTGAVGAVSTHDLQLVDEPAIAAVARQVHFSEQFTAGDGATAMTFDYRLRPGKATSSNALTLLELVGLGRRE